MQQNQHHEEWHIVTDSDGTRTETRVTSVNGAVTKTVTQTSDGAAKTPKPKIGIKKAYRKKAPITLGSVKDWPEEPLAFDDDSNFGRIDLSKMTLDSIKGSGMKVHAIRMASSQEKYMSFHPIPVEVKEPSEKSSPPTTEPAEKLSSPPREPVKKSSPVREPIMRSPSPAKESIMKAPSPAKEPEPKPPSPTKEPVVKLPSPAREPVQKSPSPPKKPVIKLSSPAKEPVKKSPSPAREPVKRSPSPVKEPIMKAPSPAKEPEPKSPSPAKEPVVKLPSPAREPVQKSPSPPKEPVKRSPSPNKEFLPPISPAEAGRRSPSPCKSPVLQRPSSKQTDASGKTKEKAPAVFFPEEEAEIEFVPRNVEIKKNQDVNQWYSVDQHLGSGKFGVVRLSLEKETGKKCAIKFIPIGSDDERDSVLTEIKVMSKLQHPRLIQLLDAFISKEEAALVMEVISGGELFERIIDDSFELTESKCVQFMTEVLEGVKFIHEKHVIHLDLKPENILCLNRTGFKLKIIDFGLARFWRFGEDVRVMFGTPEFVAPEVLSYDQVTNLTDMWSVGVICYVLLSGLSPFMGNSDRETFTNITKAHFGFDYPEFKEISLDAKDFVKKLLAKEMRNRMSAAEALNHKWLQKKSRLKRTGTVSKRALRRFVYRRKWQKAKNIIVALLRMGVTLTR